MSRMKTKSGIIIPDNPDRRRFLRYSGAGIAAALLPGKAEAANFFMKRFLARPPKKPSFITSNEDFYLVQYAGFQKVNVNNWSLQIRGKVRKPLRFTYNDILKRPSVEKMVTLQCIENEPAGEQISNAVWTGVPLKSLIEEAMPRSSVQDVAMFGADDYSDSITLERAMNYDVFLAYAMNGKQLPMKHGFPLRAVVPGIYGIKNVKWLQKIELVDYDYKGYWQKKSWSDDGTIKVTSRIDDPGDYNTLTGDYTLRGLAFSGYNGIRTVELTFDGGKTWEPTKLLPTPSPYSWVFWEYEWKRPKPRSYQITSRAVDNIGRIQTDFNARAFPSGTSGLHSVITFVD
ncbi:MAG: molybdopterin-dependent oxidoreductase [Nitrospiria bacterium]